MSFYKFLKMSMVIFNFIIFIGGAILLGVGIWIKVDGNSLFQLLEKVTGSLKVLAHVGYLCIALGTFLMVVGFLGYCGARKENQCMLMTFFLIILVIFLAQLVAAVIILVFSAMADIFLSYMKAWFLNFLQNEYHKDMSIFNAFDAVMIQFKCCGIDGYIDFTNSDYVNETGFYPSACCQSLIHCKQPAEIPGCYQIILMFLKKNTIILAAIALVVAVLEMGAMVSSMILYCQVNKQKTVA
ncbi:tetraspanin-1-like [Narcine bancroftii]|uniref:tetraspanin-1-like n=1 Tax=Narcine bancroftii TaxID=1343680 RepID=UPI0038314D2B